MSDDDLAVDEAYFRRQTALRGLMREYDRRAGLLLAYDTATSRLEAEVERLAADLARARGFLTEATGTLPVHGFANDERGDQWVRWAERVAAYLTEVRE